MTQPSCCICDPEQCAADDTGQHCADRSCGVCLHGCPAPDGEPCCQDGPSTVTVELPGISR
ncbi:hypothetical protein E1211_15290 [Micromonospora sp. 15K316]|uniref:hypothetical protein n=1 Tax=Micromonospora sp. 15K316 TaxID=2530376 RepID=UPI00104BBDC4|nr:hypothetical protein [Micromonospora sp. 15K316]TDC35668.1 hypothetical protein E1211_15290 [Micromonospora sp. 15K316]